ncbi:MAG: tetratricopeptide repeat protein [Pseudomonadota bacterium]
MSTFGELFGQLVRNKRGIEGLSQEALAAKAFGDSAKKTRVSELESGKIPNPRAVTIDAYKVALDITEEEVAGLRRNSNAQPQPGQAQTQTAFNLPPTPTDDFFGRGEQMAQLEQALNTVAAAIQSLRGMGGVGKTTLALHYANQPELAQRFPIRWWVEAETELGIQKSLADLGRTLGEAEVQEPDANAAQKTLIWLRARPRAALILYDNAQDAAVLKPYLPGPTATALVTTRVRKLAGLAEVPLEQWEVETARDYLLKRTGEKDVEAATELAEALGGLPLACAQAAAYCEGDVETLVGYLAIFREQPEFVLDQDNAGDETGRTISRTFQLSLDKAKEECPAAETMLTVMSQLAPAPLPMAVFGHEKAPEGLQTEAEARKARAALIRWALVERAEVRDKLQDVTTDCLAAHRLVLLAAKVMAPEGALESAAGALGRTFPLGVQNGVKDWPLCAALAPHASNLLNVTSETMLALNNPQNITQALTQAAGFYQFARADYTHACELFQAALSITEATFGSDHPAVAIALSNLANTFHGLGGVENLLRARQALERSLEIHEAVGQHEHLRTATSLSNLAAVLKDLGGRENLVRAKEALEQALRIEEATRGHEDESIAVSLSVLSTVLRNLGGVENLLHARAALERSIKIVTTALGSEHPQLATNLSNLANVLMDLGGPENLSQARNALERALKIREATHGMDHPFVATHLSNLAMVLRQVGGSENLSKARVAQERGLKIAKISMSYNHPDVAVSYSNLALILMDLGGTKNLSDALEALDRALKIDEAAFGPVHPNIGIGYLNRASILAQMKDISGALEFAKRAYTIFVNALGLAHDHTQNAAEWIEGLSGDALN